MHKGYKGYSNMYKRVHQVKEHVILASDVLFYEKI